MRNLRGHPCLTTSLTFTFNDQHCWFLTFPTLTFKGHLLVPCFPHSHPHLQVQSESCQQKCFWFQQSGGCFCFCYKGSRWDLLVRINYDSTCSTFNVLLLQSLGSSRLFLQHLRPRFFPRPSLPSLPSF